MVVEAQNKLALVVSQQEVRKAVSRLAAQLNRDYRGRPLVLVGVLKGSFIFLADLVRHLDLSVRIEFLRVAAYGMSNEPSQARVRTPLGASIRGKDVVVVEDIVDSGVTTAFVLDYLRRRRPASVRLCALLDKPARRRVPVAIDYLGLTVPDRFLVGYGLDFAEQYRHLPSIYALEVEEDGPQATDRRGEG